MKKILIGVIVLALVALGVFVFLIKGRKSGEVVYDGEGTPEQMEAKIQEDLGQKSQGASSEMQAGKVKEYSNERFGYSIQFPESWNNFPERANDEFTDQETVGGQALKMGGYNFWSNYSSIEEYNPENRPMDFHMLRLTIVQGDQLAESEMIRNLLSLEEGELKTEDFQAGELLGKQYSSQETDSKSYQSVIVFKNGDLIYVFNPIFMNGNAEVASLMEEMVKTFRVAD